MFVELRYYSNDLSDLIWFIQYIFEVILISLPLLFGLKSKTIIYFFGERKFNRLNY